MRILLVYPSTLDDQDKPVKYHKAHLPPLSLATIAALTPRQHTVRVINDFVEDLDFSEAWDLVGLTTTLPQAERAYQVADEFRRRGIRVVIGGIHASMLPLEAKQHADAVVIGEAENIWTDVLADCERGRLQDYYQDSDLPDLQRVIVPRWECLNMGVYRRRMGSQFPMMPIYTTRGCPYGCRFCAVTKFLGKSYRTRPIASVLGEIQGTRAKEYFFVDDNIAAKPDYARELFGSLQKLNLRWMSQASTTILRNPDLLDRAAAAGCFGLFIGTESLSEDSLAGVRKSFNKTEFYDELIERMRRAGITPILSFIFGFDEDSEDQFETTIRFLNRNRVAQILFWILTPIPGTDLFAELHRAGRITTTRWSRYDGTHVVFQPKTWTAAELLDRYWDAFQRIYRPPRLWRNIVWNTRFSKRPWEALPRHCFIQRYFWLKVRAREHPYSGGVGRVTGR